MATPVPTPMQFMHGTTFVAHKVAAPGRLVDRFGAYLCCFCCFDRELEALTEKAYLLNSMFYIGYDFFHDH